MKIIVLDSFLTTVSLPRVHRLSREAALALASIVALAAVLRFSNLDALGYGNHYHTAGVESLLQS